MATSARESAADVAAEVWQLLRAVSDDPDRAAAEHRLMIDSGITGGPLRVLQIMPLIGAVPMRELAARLHCDNSYVTALVDVLERKRYATREVHPTDRRVKVIELTAAGRDLAGRVQAADAVPPASFARLTKTELTTLRALARKLDAGP